MTLPSISPPAPLRDNLFAQWMLREDVTFLNHGSFGAGPRSVLAEQDRWRHRLEAEPIELLGRRQGELIAPAKEPLGKFLPIWPPAFAPGTQLHEAINA